MVIDASCDNVGMARQAIAFYYITEALERIKNIIYDFAEEFSMFGNFGILMI